MWSEGKYKFTFSCIPIKRHSGMIPGKSTTVADFEDRGPGQGWVAEYKIKYLIFIGS